MGKIKAFFMALRAGEQLSNSATWKNRQTAASAIMVLLGIIAPLLGRVGIDVSGDDMGAVAGGIAVVGGLLNAYLTNATSRKVGLPAGDKNPDNQDIDPSDIMGIG